MGDNAIQKAMSQDKSSEGTAGRIVSLSTGLFDLYKQSSAAKTNVRCSTAS